jgi:hypothetical protein
MDFPRRRAEARRQARRPDPTPRSKKLLFFVDFAVCSFDASVEPEMEGSYKVRKDTNDAILVRL